MRWNINHLQTRLYLAAGGVLLLGIGSALLLYLYAVAAPDSALIDEFLISKRYLHEVKRHGGNVSVLADQLSRWFNGLWRGESLAFTVATIAAGVSAALFFVGYHSPEAASTDGRGQDSHGEPGHE